MSMPMPLSPRPQVFCAACRGALHPVGRVPIRKDTLQAGAVTTAQPGDGQPVIALDAYRCHDCGRVEFYDHDFLLPGI